MKLRQDGRRLPANINHPEAEPMIIGSKFLVKINTNIGNSATSSTIEGGSGKGRLELQMGWRYADGLIYRRKYSRDTGMDYPELSCSVGTVPMYQAMEKVHGKARKTLTWELFKRYTDRTM